ncbi:uncharacterized protein LOC114973185 [Acropora millepora]|uniref:uncharacterized protein LOC114973185 n=1 Tax=Acropora millepora TaxID=45264 RepID=UPI001CF3DF77|nr:uncharacterized protein LOC114973185 [Acropora millepora]
MSTRGSRRIGRGRKRINDSSATKRKVWNRGYTRIWLDSVIYSSWISAKSLCGNSSDSKFAGHLLSLEQRRRKVDSGCGIQTSPRRDMCTPLRKRTRLQEVVDGPTMTSTPVQCTSTQGPLPANESPLQLLTTPVNESMQVDITGVSALEDLQFLGDTSYRILDDSVMVSRSSSVSSRSSVEESEDELSFTLNDVLLDEALRDLNHHKDLDEIESDSEEQSLCKADLEDLEEDWDWTSWMLALFRNFLPIHENNVMSNNLQAIAAVLLSGNNFAKVEKFASFMGLSFISPSTFYRVQKLYCLPAIDEWWEWMRGELLVEFENEELVVCGDGPYDSPGYSAKNLCYYLMEVVSEYILEVEVAAIKGNEKIARWSDHIINHIWYCCAVASECTNHVKATSLLKNKWIGLLHHVCNDHEWTGGQCDHKELVPDDQHPPWFDRRDQDFAALQKVILEPTLLDSLKYYVKFRHTGSLECANSMSLRYTLKRCSYKFQVYKARRQLAAVDWSYHVSRPISVNDKGEARHTRKYNQRAKEWNTKVVKVSKDFQYIPIMMAKIFKRIIDDTSPIDRHISMSEDDLARIAPTIAQVPPVSSKELFLRHQTRFSKCKTDLFSVKQSTEPNKE